MHAEIRLGMHVQYHNSGRMARIQFLEESRSTIYYLSFILSPIVDECLWMWGNVSGLLGLQVAGIERVASSDVEWKPAKENK